MKQQTFASLDYAHKKKQTRRERFLSEMERCIPWEGLLAVIEPHYPRGGRRGGQPIGLEVMLRIYLMQQWFGLSDPLMEDSLYEVASMRNFAGLELNDERIPDESTILQFRHLLERHHLTQGLFEAVQEHLREQGYHLSKGTMVDATLIAASGSTKNQARERDREMRSTRKGGQYYFGMKVHIGADVDSGAAHEVAVTAANEADIDQLPNLLRADDAAVFGDAGYASDSYKRGARALGIGWYVNDKRKPGRGNLSASQKQRNRRHSRVRARVEHIFRIIKCQFGYRRVRYKGLAKNRAQVLSLVALANIYLLRRSLMAC